MNVAVSVRHCFSLTELQLKNAHNYFLKNPISLKGVTVNYREKQHKKCPLTKTVLKQEKLVFVIWFLIS